MCTYLSTPENLTAKGRTRKRPPEEEGPEEESQRKKAHRYVIFKFDEKKREVVVEKIGGPAESYDDFVAALPDNDCRYAIYDFDFVTSENCQKSKIFFIAWSPSTARIREKMLYATSKDRFRKEAGRYTLRDSGY